MKKVTFKKWDVVEHLKTDRDMALYLEACLAEGDRALVAAAKSDIARARGMPQDNRLPRRRPGTRLSESKTTENLIPAATTPIKSRDARTVAGCTDYKGPVRSIEDMHDGIRTGATERQTRR